jgi:hypothetical protein
MTASELITQAATKGLALTLEGESIRVRGPLADPEAAALIEEIRSCKAEMVEALKVPEGRIRAVEICSNTLEAHIWFAFDPTFELGDGLAVFYADELEALEGKDPESLRKVHEIKLTFGPGSRLKSSQLIAPIGSVIEGRCSGKTSERWRFRKGIKRLEENDGNGRIFGARGARGPAQLRTEDHP